MPPGPGYTGCLPPSGPPPAGDDSIRRHSPPPSHSHTPPHPPPRRYRRWNVSPLVDRKMEIWDSRSAASIKRLTHICWKYGWSKENRNYIRWCAYSLKLFCVAVVPNRIFVLQPLLEFLTMYCDLSVHVVRRTASEELTDISDRVPVYNLKHAVITFATLIFVLCYM